MNYQFNYNNNHNHACLSPVHQCGWALKKSQVSVSHTRRRVCQALFDLVGIVVLYTAYLLVYFLVPARIQSITCDSADISYPKYSDSVPMWVVALYGSAAPIIFIIFIELYNSKLVIHQQSSVFSEDRKVRFKTFTVCLFHGLSLFVFGTAIVLLLTEVGKKSVGRLRPHFLAVCAPNFATVDCLQPAMTGNFFNSFTTGGSFCTGAASDISEARLSFPSGHASFSTYTMLFLILYLEARFFQLETRYMKSLIQIGASIVAFYTSLSRIVDYAHRLSDVIAGAVLGAFVALFIVFVIGRVLWEYEIDQEKRKNVEIDQKLTKKKNQQLRLGF